MADAGPRRALGQLGPRPRGKRTHVCCACDFPIAVYGRCAPCFHAYCLTCAASMARCIICGAAITKLERIPAESGLFISPLTLQGFRTEADLARHAQQVTGKLQEVMAGGSGGGMGMHMHMQHGMPGMGVGTHVMRAGMPGSMQMYQHQQQQQPRPPGWKPPPPPGPPPPNVGAGGGYGRGQQRTGGPPRHGQGGVMRPV